LVHHALVGADRRRLAAFAATVVLSPFPFLFLFFFLNREQRNDRDDKSPSYGGPLSSSSPSFLFPFSFLGGYWKLCSGASPLFPPPLLFFPDGRVQGKNTTVEAKAALSPPLFPFLPRSKASMAQGGKINSRPHDCRRKHFAPLLFFPPPSPRLASCKH